MAKGDQRLDFIHSYMQFYMYRVISSGINLQNELQYMFCTEYIFSHLTVSMEVFLIVFLGIRFSGGNSNFASVWHYSGHLNYLYSKHVYKLGMTCKVLDYVFHPLNLWALRVDTVLRHWDRFIYRLFWYNLYNPTDFYI